VHDTFTGQRSVVNSVRLQSPFLTAGTCGLAIVDQLCPVSCGNKWWGRSWDHGIMGWGWR